MAEGKTNMFGKTYNTIGSTDSNFIIKTKGDLKILWGGKYIDLIKNGKIAYACPTIFNIIDSEDEIKNDGIYLLDGQLLIIIGDNKFNITDKISNSSESLFVSYNMELDINSELKHKALTNIGLYYKSLNDIPSLFSGIVYIETEQKLYTVINGIIKPYLVEVELEQAMINEFNELIVGPLHLYSNDGIGIIDSSTNMMLSSQGIPYITILDIIKINESVLIDNTKQLSSEGATLEVGYRLYIENGLSTLEIDNLVQRRFPLHITYSKLMEMIENNKLLPKMYYLISDFQNPWEVSWEDENLYFEDKQQEINGKQYTYELRNAMYLIVHATGYNTIDLLVWDPLHPEWVIHYDPYYLEQFRYRKLDDTLVYLKSKGRIIYLKDEYGNEGNFNFRHFKFKRDKNWNYCMDSLKSLYGEFLIGNNNKFIIDSIEAYIQVFQCEPIFLEEQIIGYNIISKDSDIRMSLGHNILINSVSYNNTFKLGELIDQSVQHTIEEEVEFKNNIIEIIQEIKIQQGSKFTNNIIKNTLCIIKGVCEGNTIIDSTKIDPKGQLLINNHIEKTILTIDNSEGLILDNTINNSTISISNNGIINKNNIENCQGSITNSGNIENNIIKSLERVTNENNIINNTIVNVKIISNSGTILDNLIVNSNTVTNTGTVLENNIKESNNINNSSVLLNNVIQQITSMLINKSNMAYNHINIVDRLTNNNTLTRNTFESIEILTNNGEIINNNIKSILGTLEFDNIIIDSNIINNLGKNVINGNIVNNKIDNLDNCTIYGDINNNNINSLINVRINNNFDNNNIKGVIKESTLGKFSDNKIDADIETCIFTEFTNNEVKERLYNFKCVTSEKEGSGIITKCIFNRPIETFNVEGLYYCIIDNIKDLSFAFIVQNTTFHGTIGGILTRKLKESDIELLLDEEKKKDVYPNIQVIVIPELIIPGMIIMWYGGKKIPRGWAVCDGNNGTPDLRERFIKGSSIDNVKFSREDAITPKGVLEDNTFKLTEEHLPLHNHPHQEHTHAMSELKGYAESSGQLIVYGSRLVQASSISAVLGVSSSDASISTSRGTSGYYYSETSQEYKGGNHTHTVVVSGGEIYPSTSMEDTLKTWTNTPITIEPRHYRLVFIMKIDK